MPTAAPNLLSVADRLTPETVRVGLEGAGKDEVLEALLALLAGNAAVTDLDQVRQDVLAREAQLSTGVGLGLGLPHARTLGVRGTVAAFATTARPVDFGAHDGAPVRLLFLLVGPEAERGRHLRLLGRVSRLMNRAAFRAALLAAESPADVLALFHEAEAALAV